MTGLYLALEGSIPFTLIRSGKVYPETLSHVPVTPMMPLPVLGLSVVDGEVRDAVLSAPGKC